jgi:outer membrane usher protein
LANVRKIATPWFRGGIVARFDATKVQGFVGHVFIREKGESKPAEYGNLVLSVPNQSPVTAVVGEGGEFYVENLEPGKVPVRVEWQQKICRFDITIPGSEDLMVDLGMLTCEMH